MTTTNNTNTNTLFALTERMAEIEAILEESGGEITPELESAWAETRESLVTKVDSYNALLNKVESYSENIGKEIKRLQALKKTADNSLKSIKQHVYDAMVQNGIRSIDGQLCKFSIAKNGQPSLSVDEPEVFARYQSQIDKVVEMLPPYIKLDLSVDSKAVSAFYKETNGILPQGMTYTWGEHLVRK